LAWAKALWYSSRTVASNSRPYQAHLRRHVPEQRHQGLQRAAGLEATVVPGLTGVFTPKVDSPRDVIMYDALVEHFEARNGVLGLEYIVSMETVAGIQNCREIAKASPRVGAMIGPSSEHADIARAVGYEWTPEGLETLYLRSRVLLACREADIHPLTALWEDLENLDGLRAFAKQGRGLGSAG
jgi:citrate lyase subunit beta/citryl-CoA lyase